MRTLALALALASTGGCAAQRAERGASVVLVTVDGTRWQEVFRGADESLLTGLTGETQEEIRTAFWRASPEERRRVLMPFLWGTMARQGQLFGNVDRGSEVVVTNAFKISYPGYHELLCGFPSVTLGSNQKTMNPDVTVLEWLARRPGFRESVAAYVSWDVFPFILNQWRAGFPVSAGEIPGRPTPFDRLRDEVPPPWRGSVYDAFVVHGAMRYLEERAPRVFYLALGDTDEWAHQGRYDRYLQHIRRVDDWLRELWEKLQATAAYRGRTSLIVTTDHGRGDGPEGWRGHSAQILGSERIWVAAMGPGTPAVGERSAHAPLRQSQVAATVARLVGEDYASAAPGVAPSLPLSP